MTRNRHPRAGAAVIVMAALVGALVAGGVSLLRDPGQSPAGSVPRADRLPDSIVGTPPAAALPSDAPQQRAGPPRRISIPALDIDLAVESLGVDAAGAMALPDTAYRVAWYRWGSHPLDPDGAAVIAGHVDTDTEGIGPLSRLSGVDRGDRIEVTAGGREIVYSVVSVTRIPRAVLNLPAIFSRTGPARLHLITCGGEYLPEQGGYQDNVVVEARRMVR